MIGITFPIIVLFLLQKGLDFFVAGTCIAAYSASTIMLELPTGGLADSIGRKRVNEISLFFSFMSGLVLLISWGFLILVMGVVGMGCARALSSGTIDAWFVDEFKERYPQGNLQQSLSRANTFIPIGIGLGSLGGGIIPSLSTLQVKELSGFGPYSMNIVAMEIMVLLMLIVTSTLVKETLTPKRQSGFIAGFKQTPLVLATSIKFGIKNRGVLMLLISAAALGVALASVELLWQPRTAELMGGVTQTWALGLLAAGYFFISSLGNMASIQICRLFSHDYVQVLIVTTLGTAAVLFLLALQSELLLFALLYLLLYFSLGIAFTPQAMLFNR